MQKNFCISEGGTWQGIGAFWSDLVCGAFGRQRIGGAIVSILLGSGSRAGGRAGRRAGWGPRGRARKFPRAGRPGRRPEQCCQPGCGHSGDVAAEPPRTGRGDGALWTALRGSCRPCRPSRAVETRTQGCLPIFTEICALRGALGGSRGGGRGAKSPPPFLILKFDSTFLWFVASLF